MLKKKSAKKISLGRHRFMFWLRGDVYEERELIQLCWELQDSRQFAKTIRDGLRLMNDLRGGNTQVLRELFPEIASQNAPDIHQMIRDALSGYVALPASTNTPIPDLSDMIVEVSAREDTESGDNFLESIFNF